ncbi:galactose mutarotase-like [Leptidea sinapis]|uniref:galactose mutarotase-like n=1 Tax=Leptidea sinapis TaxID=189913 RepID=UPI0021432743|nr:galactose mutarotase-like [Leptidea sinapis]XP_050682876.1 galactose mutarotase-like [Leptidea sinapis]
MVYLTEQEFGVWNDEVVKKYTWRTDSGFSLSAISFGAVVQNIFVPDRDGNLSDVVLGFDDLDSYVNRNTDNFGCVVGRVANRIADGTFQLDGRTYSLARNWRGIHHLHGGTTGFDKVNWNSVVSGNKVIFSRVSKDGEEGYPGDLLINITYEVTDEDTWCIEYRGVTTEKTLVNLTNHSYFNLAGHETGAQELYNHIININADKMLETRKDWIPTGKLIPIAGTPLDLFTPKRLGDFIELSKILFHHNFCVATHSNKEINFISRVVHPASGRFMEVYSDQPSITFYTGNFLPSDDLPAIPGKYGVSYSRHSGLCLEAQKCIDAIHHPNFPSIVLKPGEVYTQKTEYRFGVIRNGNGNGNGAKNVV